MSAVSLNTNLASQRAIRRLGESSRELSGTFERLSSGQRINRAADDAAGLAVASSLNTKARVYSQAYRNINDGISFLNIAEGATGELKNILFRLRELSTQASSGTFSNTQRQSLDVESQALQGEYNRILESTTFNGRKIFSGSNSRLTVQAGFGQNSTLTTVLAGSTAVTTGDGTFTPRLSLNGGYSEADVSITDFNGDGILDIASTDTANTPYVHVFIGNGDGSFKSAATYSTGARPYSIITGDFDGDGNQDVITGNWVSNTITVHLGNGDGSLKAGQAFSVAAEPHQIAAGDFDGDGDLDVMAATYGGTGLYYLAGNGDGTFSGPLGLNAGGNTRGVIVRDFNGDGKLDLATGDSLGSSVSVYLGNGNGTFSARTSYVVGAGADRINAADFDGDGYIDIVSADKSANTASILFGNGDGSFGSRVVVATGGAPYDVVTGDFNGDGKSDFAVTESGSNQIAVVLSNGDRTFSARQVYATGAWPYGLEAADLNGDGALDLASADFLSSDVSVFFGNTKTSVTNVGLQSISGISVATQSAALAAQGQVDSYLDNVNTISGIIGASISRFETAARMVSTTSDVFRAAESRIIDADMALETAKLTRTSILQQAASAVLAQANQQPALALTLLTA